MSFFGEVKVNTNISNVDLIPFDTILVDVLEDRVQLQAARTDKENDNRIIASSPIEIDFEAWDKLHDLISTERSK